MDVNGDSLDVGGDIEASLTDLKSILKKKYRDRVTYDEETGSVSFNAEGLKRNKDGELKDADARLLLNLTTSDEKYYYAVTDKHGENIEGSWSKDGPHEPFAGQIDVSDLEGNITGVEALSALQNTSKTLRGDEGRSNGIPYTQPTQESGYDGVVTISPGTPYIRRGGEKIAARAGLVRHELKESYYRTTGKMTYEQAHNKAGGISSIYSFTFK